jgi:hypothetical protein
LDFSMIPRGDFDRRKRVVAFETGTPVILIVAKSLHHRFGPAKLAVTRVNWPANDPSICPLGDLR